MKSSQFEREQQQHSRGQVEPRHKLNLSNVRESNGLGEFSKPLQVLNVRREIPRALKQSNEQQQQQVATSRVNIEIVSKQQNGDKKQFNDNSRTTIHGNNKTENGENYHYRPTFSEHKSLKFNSASRNNKSKQQQRQPQLDSPSHEDENVLRDADDQRDRDDRHFSLGSPRTATTASPIVVVSHQFSGGNNLISAPARETSTGPGNNFKNSSLNGRHSRTSGLNATTSPASRQEQQPKVCSTINNKQPPSDQMKAHLMTTKSSSSSPLLLHQQQQHQVNNHSRPSTSNHSNQSFLSSYLSIGSTKSSTATDSGSTTSGFSSEGSSVQTLGRQDRQSVAEMSLGEQQVAEQSSKQKRSVRSRLIEDLDRLERIAAAVAANQSAGSPTINSQTMLGAPNSHRESPPTRASTLSRCPQTAKQNQGEFDYFTLCRDEFSSFIATTDACHQPEVKPESSVMFAGSPKAGHSSSKRPRRSAVTSSGPTLVGVHECSSSPPRPVGLMDSRQSPSSFGTPDDDDEDEEDDYHSRQDRDSDLSPEQMQDCYDPMTMYDNRCDEAYEDRHLDYNHEQIAKHIPQQHCEVQVEEYFSDESEQHEGTSIESSRGSSSLKCEEIVMQDDWQRRILEASQQEAESLQYEPLVSEEVRADCKNLSQMLDVYLERVDLLLRLAGGDKSVTPGEAFGGKQIPVNGEHQTAIEFTPYERLNSRRVVQEIEMIVESPEKDSDDDHNYDDHQRYLITNIVAENFRSLLSTPQTSAKLNWWSQELKDLDYTSLISSKRKPMIEDCKSLEESLLRKWVDNNQELRRSNIKPQDLVKSVRSHIDEFVANFNTYHRELDTSVDFASDWHQNWLFAYKRPHWSSNVEQDEHEGSSSPKQARLSLNHEDPQELIEYSTLLLSKHKTSTKTRLSYLLENHSDPENNFYKDQMNPIDELKMISIESGTQVDICRLLINDLFADESDCFDGNDDNNNNVRYRKVKKRPLEIRYESSLDRISSGLFRLFACGHLIESSKLREISNSPTSATNKFKLLELQRSIMTKLLELTMRNIKPLPNLANDEQNQDQVKFLINLTNVELINQLSVIQFCAKIAGALPIKVSWFKLANEDDDHHKSIELNGEKMLKTKRVVMRKQVLINDAKSLNHLWPICMHANHDFEYQNDWSSWFRFKRSHDDILFEIRDADLTNDYNKIYKCVIENYCSRKECQFRLSRRQLEEQKSTGDHQSRFLANENKKLIAKRKGRLIVGEQENDELDQVKLRELSHETGNQEAGHALLRTWSQRTMNRVPKASGGGELCPLTDEHGNSIDELTLTSANQQTVGRLSSSVHDENKFGADFPYHPENLIKRLEENKYSISLRSPAGATLKRQQQANCKLQQQIRPADESEITFVDDKSSRLEADYQNINSSDQEQQINYNSRKSTMTAVSASNLKPTNESGMQFEELTSSSVELTASLNCKRLTPTATTTTATSGVGTDPAHLNETKCPLQAPSEGRLCQVSA